MLPLTSEQRAVIFQNNPDLTDDLLHEYESLLLNFFRYDAVLCLGFNFTPEQQSEYERINNRLDEIDIEHEVDIDFSDVTAEINGAAN